MKRRRFLQDQKGTSAIEFAIVGPVFIMLAVGMTEAGVILWTQLGLQHGVEMAARCSSVNTTLCGSPSAIQDYAAQRSLGVNPPASTFTVNSNGCGIQVSASYTYQFASTYFGAPSIVLTAQSCVPQRLTAIEPDGTSAALDVARGSAPA